MARFPAYSLLVLALSVSACACSKEENALKLNYDFVGITGKTPESFSSWKANAFVFSEGMCSAIYREESLSDLKTIRAKSGDVVTLVAYSSDSNLGFTALRKGDDAEAYSLVTLDSKAETGEIWYASSTVSENDETITQVLQPLTSTITFSVNDKPENFESAGIIISGFGNRWDIYKDSLCADHSRIVSMSLKEGTVTVLPMQEDQETWGLEIDLAVGGKVFHPLFPALPRIDRGQHVEVSIDLKDFASSAIYSVTCKATDAVEGKEKYSQTKRFTALERGDNTHYAVSIFSNGSWEKMEVYDALCSNAAKHTAIWNDWANEKALRDTMSYCIFENDFEGPVKVRVSKLDGTFNTCEVRPSPYGIQATVISNSEIEFTIPSYDMRKLSVEFDGDRFHNLFLYGYKPDQGKPTESSATVKYYGPGVHHAGTITLNAGQTLYLDYGAKVYANVVTYGDNVTIAGHGILSGENMKHFGDNQYSWGDFLICCNKNNNSLVKNLTIKDITMIDSPGWNMCVRTTEGVSISGVNMISWELNGDGVDIVSCKDVEIADCFLRNYDDCITLKCRFIVEPISEVCNVRIHDNLIWNDFARGIVVGPEAGKISDPGYIHDVEIYDCIFLEHGNGAPDDLRAAFCIGQGSNGRSPLWQGTDPPMPIRNITAANLTFDHINKNGRAIAIRQYADSNVKLSNVTFKNFKVLDRNGNRYPAMYIWTRGASIEGLQIMNLTYNGNAITSTGAQFGIDKPERVSYTIE
ncbi:MAG: glycosyl hydrolase family 28 protein [Candidatus Cryptobacteroides sp.]|jgi:hypothetical protein